MYLTKRSQTERKKEICRIRSGIDFSPWDEIIRVVSSACFYLTPARFYAISYITRKTPVPSCTSENRCLRQRKGWEVEGAGHFPWFSFLNDRLKRKIRFIFSVGT